jgi:hypothetical protein
MTNVGGVEGGHSRGSFMAVSKRKKVTSVITRVFDVFDGTEGTNRSQVTMGRLVAIHALRLVSDTAADRSREFWRVFGGHWVVVPMVCSTIVPGTGTVPELAAETAALY